MTTLGDDGEQPISWKAILADTPIHSREGERVGTVGEVLGAEQQDIFHGLVLREADLAREVMIPATHVTSITTERIEVDLPRESIHGLPTYIEEESYRLGLTGFLRHKLGWVPEGRDRA